MGGEENLEDRPREACEALCLQGDEGEDRRWDDEGQAHEEQERKGRLQGSVSGGQEALRVWHRPLDEGGPGRKESVEHQGLRHCRREDGPGQGALREGEGAVHECVIFTSSSRAEPTLGVWALVALL